MNEEIIDKVSFDDGVFEYKAKQQEVVKNFVLGCIEIWEILLRYRNMLKPEWMRLKYLEEIKLNNTMAGNQIRLYELSQWKIEKEVLSSFITNWEKLNLFLPLPDEQKEKLVAKNLNSETTTEEFREAIVEVKNENLPIEAIDYDSKYEDEMRKKIEESTNWWNPLLLDTQKASKVVQEAMWLSMYSRELLEWVVYIEKTKEILRNNKSNISEIEKEKIKSMYIKQLIELEESMNLFF